jgi:hypothetical protein
LKDLIEGKKNIYLSKLIALYPALSEGKAESETSEGQKKGCFFFRQNFVILYLMYILNTLKINLILVYIIIKTR